MKIVNKFMLSVIALVAAALSQPGHAREFAEIYTQCGLGAIIAPKTEGVAAVTNVTWDLGTTAISSNVSSPDTCQGGKAKTAAFMHDAYAYIEKNLATGNGPYLDTLLALSGCEAAARPAIVGALRSDFSKIVADPGYSSQTRYEHANGLYNIFYRRIGTDFAGSCHIA